MKKSKPLVFFGTETFSAASLQKLVDDEWPVGLVVTKPDFRRGRGQRLEEPPVKTIAKKHSIPVLQPDKLAQISNELYLMGSSYAVLVSYGKIIPQAIIDIFPGGIINLHPSMLPKYRGPAPIEAAILNGDESTGLTLMKLSADMDAGPIYAQEEVPLNGTETQAELYEELAELGADFLSTHLADIINGELKPRDQDDAHATYTHLLNKADGRLDISKPAIQLERQVRAFSNWPRSRINLFGHEVIVTRTKVLDQPTEDGLVIECSPDWLEIEELVAPSGRKMSGRDFVRGYKKT